MGSGRFILGDGGWWWVILECGERWEVSFGWSGLVVVIFWVFVGDRG